MGMNIGPHVADDVLERYLLQRLPEAELASVEEHLLACPECQVQAEETEEFILATKVALRDVERNPAALAFLRMPSGFLNAWSRGPAIAAILAAVAVAIVLPLRYNRASMPPSEVHLYAMRGPDASSAHARAGSGLFLDLDAPQLAAGVEYRVRVVDSGGAEVWSGVSQRVRQDQSGHAQVTARV